MRNNEEGIGIVWWSLVEGTLFKRYAMNTIICLKMLMILGSICRLKSINQPWKQKPLKNWSRKPQQTVSFTPSMTLWSVMGDPGISLAWPVSVSARSFAVSTDWSPLSAFRSVDEMGIPLLMTSPVLSLSFARWAPAPLIWKTAQMLAPCLKVVSTK